MSEIIGVFLAQVAAKPPPWAYHLFWAVVLATLLATLSIAAWRYVGRSKREAKYLDIASDVGLLWKSFNQALEHLMAAQTKFSQSSTALSNFNQLLLDFLRLRVEAGRAYAPEDRLQQIVELAREDLKFFAGDTHRCAIWVADGANLRILVGSGFSPEKLRARRLPQDGSIAGFVLRNGKPRLIRNVNEVEDYYRDEDSGAYLSLVCAPIVGPEGVQGVLCVDGSRESSFDKDDQQIAQVYAGFAGLYMGRSERRVAQNG